MSQWTNFLACQGKPRKTEFEGDMSHKSLDSWLYSWVYISQVSDNVKWYEVILLKLNMHASLERSCYHTWRFLW